VSWRGLRYSSTRTYSFLDEGLEKKGATMSQIPTYVTAVPNGTEQVSISTQTV